MARIVKSLECTGDRPVARVFNLGTCREWTVDIPESGPLWMYLGDDEEFSPFDDPCVFANPERERIHLKTSYCCRERLLSPPNGEWWIVYEEYHVGRDFCSATRCERIRPNAAARWFLDNSMTPPDDLRHLVEGEVIGGLGGIAVDVPQRSDAAGGGEKSCPPGYPIPDDYERDKWIFEQRKAGRTNPDIIRELETKRGWTPLYSPDSIRDAVRRYCLHHHLPVPQGRRGRPRTKTGKPRKPPSKNAH